MNWVEVQKNPIRAEYNPISDSHNAEEPKVHNNKLEIEGENEYGEAIIDINNQARNTFSSAMQTEIDAVKKPMEAYAKEQRSIWAEAFTLHKYGPQGIKTGVKNMKELIVADDTAPAMLASMYAGCRFSSKNMCNFHFDFAEGQSIKISSKYQNISCIDADFYDQGAIVQHFSGFCWDLTRIRRIPANFRKCWLKFSKCFENGEKERIV